MGESRNGVFWRGLAAAIATILISVLGYYVYLNDERWRENSDRWRELERLHRDREARLARIEESQKLILIHLEGKK